MLQIQSLKFTPAKEIEHQRNCSGSNTSQGLTSETPSALEHSVRSSTSSSTLISPVCSLTRRRQRNPASLSRVKLLPPPTVEERMQRSGQFLGLDSMVFEPIPLHD